MKEECRLNQMQVKKLMKKEVVQQVLRPFRQQVRSQCQLLNQVVVQLKKGMTLRGLTMVQ